MNTKISLRTAGIITGIAAVVAFLFGLIISTGMPFVANQGNAVQTPSSSSLVGEYGESPFTKVVELVSPAVVNISAEKKISSSMPGFEWRFEGPWDDFFKDFFKNFPKFQGKTQTLGSGFIISDDGYVVTNYHVIKGASDIVVKLTNKKEFKGDDIEIVGTDSRTDIALLKIKCKEKLPYLKFGDSDKVKVGDWAIAVGNPFHLEGTVTVGVISAKGRAGLALPEGPDFQSFLQTDAAINPGNSGGPLVNIRGEVIGINTAITSPSGGNVGIGFAIPANIALKVIDELRTKGKVVRGYLGIYLQEITEELKQALNLKSTQGVLVSEVMEDTPASRAGIKNGDVIIEFDGKPVKDMQSFRFQVASTKVGKRVKLKVIRNGKEKELYATIGEYPEKLAAATKEQKSFDLGLKVVNLDSPEAGFYNLNVKEGVLVVSVEPDSPASDAGILKGDVILTIGRTRIKNLDDYEQVVSHLKKGKPVIFHIQRRQRKLYLALTP